MRHICYVSGTRADFGLLRRALQAMQAHPDLEVSVCVTGMHLAADYGLTVSEVEKSGIPIRDRIPLDISTTDGASMAHAVADALRGMVDVFQAKQPDVVLLLGDRGEMLAGALAAIHLNIPIAHIHGGERSGTVDEPVRHCISKLAHYHFVATSEARERLIRMGEWPAAIFVTGAPGIDGLEEMACQDRAELCHAAGFDTARPVALVVFHPVVQEAESAGAHMEELLAAVREVGLQAVCLEPNADAGGSAVRGVLDRCRGQRNIKVFNHLPRESFVSWMAAADVMVGNSSSGIIEAATFGLPVVNVGNRQRCRTRGGNVIDAAMATAAITEALRRALGSPRTRQNKNPYGDGHASRRIVELLASLPLGPELLEKVNAY